MRVLQCNSGQLLNFRCQLRACQLASWLHSVLSLSSSRPHSLLFPFPRCLAQPLPLVCFSSRAWLRCSWFAMLAVSSAQPQQLPSAPSIRALVCGFHPSTRKRSRSGRYTAATTATATATALLSSGVDWMEQQQPHHDDDDDGEYNGQPAWHTQRGGGGGGGGGDGGGAGLVGAGEREQADRDGHEAEHGAADGGIGGDDAACAAAAAESAADDDSGDVEVLSVHRAAASSPASSSARRLADARRWEQLWRDKQWRVRQLADERERDNASDSTHTHSTASDQWPASQ